MSSMTSGKRLAAVLSILVFAALACSLPEIETIETTPAPPSEAAPTTIPTSEPAPTPTGAPPTQTPEPLPPADRIYLNGAVLTMNQAQPQAEALAVRAGRIQAVGSESEVLAYRGPETRVIDLGGRTLMPGFVDAHSHLFMGTFENLAEGQQMALENGITTLAEMAVRPEGVTRLYAAEEAGEVRMRLSMYPAHTNACGDQQGFWYEGYAPDTRPGARVHLPGVKVYADGGACNVPAVSFEYPNGAGSGDLHFSAEELAAMVHEIQAVGYQVAIHALGDRAVATVVDALAEVQEGGTNSFRHRIEHVAVLTPELLSRLQTIDAVVLIPGAFPACLWQGDTSAFKYITPEEFRDYEWRWRELLDANPGAHIGWHGDYPVFATLNPFAHLFGFVTRSQRTDDGGLCDPPAWAAGDAIRVEEALRLMTVGAAYSLFRDEELGSLEAGKLADMIIVSENPMTIDPFRLLDLQVQVTLVDGETAFCAPGSEPLCP